VSDTNFVSNGNFGFYSTKTTVAFTDVSFSGTRQVGITLQCPEGLPDCGETVLTPVDVQQDFGDGFHLCAASVADLTRVTITDVARFAGFLFNVGQLNVVESDFGDLSMAYRFMKKDAPILEGDFESEQVDEEFPVPEKVLWGAPPAGY